MQTQEFNNYKVRCTTKDGMRSGIPYMGEGKINIKPNGDFDFKEAAPKPKYEENKVVCELGKDNIRFEKRTRLFKITMRVTADEFDSVQKCVNRFKKLHAAKVN